MGFLDQLTMPKFQPGQFSGMKPNFQTLSGANVYSPPPTSTQIAGIGQAARNMGVRAAAPTDNTKKTQNIISSNYQSTNQPNIPQPITTPSGLAVSGNPGTWAGVPDNPDNPGSQTPQPSPTPQSQNTAPGILNTLMGTATNNPLTSGPAYQNYSTAVQNLQGVRNAAAQTAKDIGSQPIDYTFQQGRQGLAQQYYAQKETAAQQAVNQQQQALGYGIQEQQTQQSGLGTALQGALQTTQAPYGTPLYQPGTGQFTSSQNVGGQNFNPQTVAQQYAGLVKNGQMSPEMAAQYMSSLYGGAGPTFLNQALTGQNQPSQSNPSQFNYNTASGNAAAQQYNTQTAGTAGTQAAQGVFNQSYQDYLNVQQSVQNVDQFGQLLTSNMQQGGINPSDAKYANQTISQIRNQLSSQTQAQFDSTLAALVSKVSGLLSVGGNEIPTDISADARKILDGSLPYSALSGVLSRIQQEGQILLQTQGGKVNDAWGKIQSSSGGQTNTQSPNSGHQISWDQIPI